MKQLKTVFEVENKTLKPYNLHFMLSQEIQNQTRTTQKIFNIAIHKKFEKTALNVKLTDTTNNINISYITLLCVVSCSQMTQHRVLVLKLDVAKLTSYRRGFVALPLDVTTETVQGGVVLRA